MNMITRKKRNIVLILSGLLLSVLLLYFFFKPDQPAAAAYAYPPVKVAVATVESREAPRSLTAVGELEAVRQIQVAAEASGRVEKIYFQSGQYVHAGQILLKLNDAVEQGEIEQLKAKLKLHQAIYKRGHELAEMNAVAKEEVENALSNRDVTLGQIKQLNAKIQQKVISYALKKVNLEDINFKQDNPNLPEDISNRIVNQLSETAKPSYQLFWVAMGAHGLLVLLAFVFDHH